MADNGAAGVSAVTLAFREFRGSAADEAPVATEIARHYGAQHRIRWVDRAEFEQDLSVIFDQMDQPTVDGINTWFASKAMRELNVKVALSGVGGDELFGGYDSFRDIPRWVRCMKIPSRIPGLGVAFQRAVSPLLGSVFPISSKLAGIVQYGGTESGAYLLRRGLFMPWELSAVLSREVVREGLERLQPLKLIEKVLIGVPVPVFGRVALLEASLYLRNQLLRDTDWAGMAHSVEVRTPLVDRWLVDQLAPVITNSELRRSLGRAPSKLLPRRIIERAKTGFEIPMAKWTVESQAVSSWRKIPLLTNAWCHWSRRWAYSVADQFGLCAYSERRS
jgi:asparagine synthase (glutamine-hydrolysing)